MGLGTPDIPPAPKPPNPAMNPVLSKLGPKIDKAYQSLITSSPAGLKRKTTGKTSLIGGG